MKNCTENHLDKKVNHSNIKAILEEYEGIKHLPNINVIAWLDDKFEVRTKPDYDIYKTLGI